MKRILAVLLIVILAFAFTACGNGDDTQEYLEILQSGNYTIEGNAVFEGQHLMVYLYVDGETMTANYRNDNDSSRAAAYDHGEYFIFDENNRLYAKVTEDDIFPNVFSSAINYDFSTAVYDKSGKQELTGETYRYDRYTIETVDGEETLLEIYYSSGGAIYGIAFPNESIAITIGSFSVGVPDYQYTKIPDDFEETDLRQIELLLGV